MRTTRRFVSQVRWSNPRKADRLAGSVLIMIASLRPFQAPGLLCGIVADADWWHFGFDLVTFRSENPLIFNS